MSRKIHEYDNGIKVYDDQLLDIQRERYLQNNVHEAEEEPIFIDLLNGLEKNSVYINIGAAIGYYSILTNNLRSDLTIMAYEPLKKHREFFYENIELNNLNKSNFKIYPEGIYASKGYKAFKIQHYGSMIEVDDSKKTFIKKFIEYINNERIKTITLEDVWKRSSKTIGLVQMDIQGLEMEVLVSSKEFLKKHHIKSFLIGTHSVAIHKKCKEVLLESGYLITLDEYETKLQPDGILVAELAK